MAEPPTPDVIQANRTPPSFLASVVGFAVAFMLVPVFSGTSPMMLALLRSFEDVDVSANYRVAPGMDYAPAEDDEARSAMRRG